MSVTYNNLLQAQPELWETALRIFPSLFVDRLEPFELIRVGVSVFEQSAPSLSFNRTVNVDKVRVKAVFEYALYWDYDIQHIYDLEHIWIYVGHDDEIVGCEVSFHGQYMVGLLRDRSNLTADNRVKIFVQPGKHAMAGLEELFRLLPNVEAVNDELAGDGGVLEPEMFKGQFKFGANIDQLAEEHLRTFRFKPSFDYIPLTCSPDLFVSWEELKVEIPLRMKALLEKLSK